MPPHRPSLMPHSSGVQQRHGLRAAPRDLHRPLTCPNDRERPWCQEFASRGSPPVELIDGDRPRDLLKKFRLGVEERERMEQDVTVNPGSTSK